MNYKPIKGGFQFVDVKTLHIFFFFSLQDHDAEDEERLWRDLIMERVTKSADACLTALNIMTSARMPKAVYIEDVIERVLQYTKFHLQNTLYPQYDPVYRVDPHGGESGVFLAWALHCQMLLI